MKVKTPLVSNTSYIKKTLAIMKLKNTNICDNYNDIEYAEHVIWKCSKFSSIKRKYSAIACITNYFVYLKRNWLSNYKKYFNFNVTKIYLRTL